MAQTITNYSNLAVEVDAIAKAAQGLSEDRLRKWTQETCDRITDNLRVEIAQAVREENSSLDDFFSVKERSREEILPFLEMLASIVRRLDYEQKQASK